MIMRTGLVILCYLRGRLTPSSRNGNVQSLNVSKPSPQLENKMSESKSKAAVVSPQLPIHFIKSSSFRVVHASGVWYGGDSQQNLHLTFFNERNPIPKMIVLNLNEKGFITSEDESKRESKTGIVREMEVDVILSYQAALEFHRTLGENLKALGANLPPRAEEENHI